MSTTVSFPHSLAPADVATFFSGYSLTIEARARSKGGWVVTVTEAITAAKGEDIRVGLGDPNGNFVQISGESAIRLNGGGAIGALAALLKDQIDSTSLAPAWTTDVMNQLAQCAKDATA